MSAGRTLLIIIGLCCASNLSAKKCVSFEEELACSMIKRVDLPPQMLQTGKNVGSSTEDGIIMKEVEPTRVANWQPSQRGFAVVLPWILAVLALTISFLSFVALAMCWKQSRNQDAAQTEAEPTAHHWQTLKFSVKAMQGFKSSMQASIVHSNSRGEADFGVFTGTPSKGTLFEKPDGSWAKMFHVFVTGLVYSAYINTQCFDSICRQLSLKGQDEMPYSAKSMVIVGTFVGIVPLYVYAVGKGGWAGFKECWDWQQLLQFSIPSLLYNVASILKLYAMGYGLQADELMLVMRLNLLFTAAACWLFLGKGQSTQQVSVLIILVLSIVQFIMLKGQLQTDSVGLVPDSLAVDGRRTRAINLAVFAMLFDVSGATLETYIYRVAEPKPFFLQKIYLELPGILPIIVLCFFDPKIQKYGFLGGWNGYTVLVTAFYLANVWLGSWIIRTLGPVAKQLAGVCAMVMCYCVCLVTFKGSPEHKFDTNVLLSCFITAGAVICYVLCTYQEAVAAAEEYAKQAGRKISDKLLNPKSSMSSTPQ